MWQEHPVFTMPLAAIGTSNTIQVDALTDKYLHLHGTFVATVEIQGRMAPTTPWFTVASVSAPGVTSVPQSFYEMRINVSAWTSGQPEAVLGAMNARVD
jgi:hypothetical protein